MAECASLATFNADLALKMNKCEVASKRAAACVVVEDV
jgi:hypothetical protein